LTTPVASRTTSAASTVGARTPTDLLPPSGTSTWATAAKEPPGMFQTVNKVPMFQQRAVVSVPWSIFSFEKVNNFFLEVFG
jgi:hypothetical protein